MEIDYEKLGQRIKEKRLEQKYSQEELADLSELSRSYISHVEIGSKNASLETVVKIANVLGCSANDLLKDSLVSLEDRISKIEQLLLDCTPEEKELLTKTLKTLREVLRSYTIK